MSEQQQELNIESTVADIATDLGLGQQEETHEAGDTETTSVDTTETTETETTQSAPPVTETARQPPKSWAKETHELWTKLPPEAQAQIELREKQSLEGITQYSESAKFGKAISEAIAPYQEVLRVSGADAPTAIGALFKAHVELSNPDENARAAYFAKMAAHYKVDVAKLAAGASASQDEPASVRELRERTERLERERNQELDARAKETRTRVASEVSAFAEAKDDKGNPKHPYFDECHEDIVAYINAGHTLEKAYEKAVYANPVTRAKEIARLQTETEANLRAKAKQEAEKARNASRTNVNSRDTRRAPTAQKAGGWEDTLTETLHDIKSRSH